MIAAAMNTSPIQRNMGKNTFIDDFFPSADKK
jgi:hypothetical protein